MNDKKFAASTEFFVGVGLIVLGVVLYALDQRNIFTLSIGPFGAGMILTDLIAQSARAKRVRAKVRARRNK